MRFQEVYANVPLGLKEAPEHLKDAYHSLFSRYIVEALLIDNDTPPGVFYDLLGWTPEDIETYRSYFFTIDRDMPRLKMYEFVNSAPEATESEQARKNLLINVFENGWSYIDSKFNKSHRLRINDEVETNLKKMFGGLSGMVEQCMQHPTAAAMRALTAFMKEAVITMKGTELEQSPVETMAFNFVDDIQNEVKSRLETPGKIMNIEFDPLMRLKAPEGEELTELEQIHKDTGN